MYWADWCVSGLDHVAILFRFIHLLISFFFFFKDTATTDIYTLSLHDALPISLGESAAPEARWRAWRCRVPCRCRADRKSTRLNSSHSQISYAVFCLKKKTQYVSAIDQNDTAGERPSISDALCYDLRNPATTDE